MSAIPIFRAPREASVDPQIHTRVLACAGRRLFPAWQMMCGTANDRSEVTLSINDMANFFGVDASTVKRWRKGLRDRGLLKRFDGRLIVCLPQDCIGVVQEIQPDLFAAPEDEEDESPPQLKLSPIDEPAGGARAEVAQQTTSSLFARHDAKVNGDYGWRTASPATAPNAGAQMRLPPANDQSADETPGAETRLAEALGAVLRPSDAQPGAKMRRSSIEDPSAAEARGAKMRPPSATEPAVCEPPEKTCDNSSDDELRELLRDLIGAKRVDTQLGDFTSHRAGKVLQVRVPTEFVAAMVRNAKGIGGGLRAAAKELGFERVDAVVDPNLCSPQITERTSQPQRVEQRLRLTNQPTVLGTPQEYPYTTNQLTAVRPPDSPASRSGGDRQQPTGTPPHVPTRASPTAVDAAALEAEAWIILPRLGDRHLFPHLALRLAVLKLLDGHAASVEALIRDAELNGMGKPRAMFKRHQLPFPKDDFHEFRNRVEKLGVAWDKKRWEVRTVDGNAHAAAAFDRAAQRAEDPRD